MELIDIYRKPKPLIKTKEGLFFDLEEYDLIYPMIKRIYRSYIKQLYKYYKL